MAGSSNRPVQGSFRYGSRIRQIGKDLQRYRKHISKIGKRIQFVVRWGDRISRLIWNMRIQRFMTR